MVLGGRALLRVPLRCSLPCLGGSLGPRGPRGCRPSLRARASLVLCPYLSAAASLEMCLPR